MTKRCFVVTVNKRWQVPLIVALVIGGWFLYVFLTTPPPKPLGSMKIVPILPSIIYQNQETDFSPRRGDFFSIIDLDRSDSAKLMQMLIRHVCQVTDTIDLAKYEVYRIEYFENSQYLNDSTYHKVDRPLWHEVEKFDASVFSIGYHKSKPLRFHWYKSGKTRFGREVIITKDMEKLFESCR